MLSFAVNAPAQAAARYRCELHDGSVHLVQADLSTQYPDAVARCAAQALPLAPRAGTPPPAGDTLSVQEPMRTIHLGAMWPAWRDWRDQQEGPTPQRPSGPAPWLPLIQEVSATQQLDWMLVEAVVHVESRHQPQARSPKGALGLMQVIPATGARYGAGRPDELLDPRRNLAVGTRYLKDLLRLFQGRTDLALAAYNAGEGAVLRHGHRIPPYPETQHYVRQVLQRVESNSAARFLRHSP